MNLKKLLPVAVLTAGVVSAADAGMLITPYVGGTVGFGRQTIYADGNNESTNVKSYGAVLGMEDSPYMMYAVNCQPGIEAKIPAIIHVDGTCRIQTVTQEQNQHYYNLINAFYKRTGVPIIFNTSFNLGGDPLVETLEDAVDTLSKSDIEYLYIPELGKLVKVTN